MKFEHGRIISEKIINELDKFVIEFLDILEQYSSYVIVSGYVSIILGRSRATEDVDLLAPKMSFSKFKVLFDYLLNNGYECANSSIPEEAFELWHEFAIRFYKKGFPIPNIEFKMIKRELDEYSFEHRTELVLRKANKTIFISPLELQIPFKLSLSSELGDKDTEDAKHIYQLFKENINKEEMLIFLNKLKIMHKLKELE